MLNTLSKALTRADQRHKAREDFAARMKSYDISVNNRVDIPGFCARSWRPWYRLLGGTMKDIHLPGLEFMSTGRNPQTMRHMEASRHLDGTWTVKKLNFAAAARGYSRSHVRTVFKRVSFGEAQIALIVFSRATAYSPPQHRRYDRRITGRTFTGVGNYAL